MNTLKTVFGKLFKEETQLASHEVELALVDDFNKEYENALNLQAKAETAIIDYNELASKIIASLNSAGQAYLKANARFQEIEQMAKELGIEPSAQLKSKKETISVAIKELDSYNKKLTSNKINI
jgi:DNA repair ATPase RecN